MHPTVWQSAGGAGFSGQHGCAGELATDIEAQAPIGFKIRNATARIAKPNFVLAFMVSVGELLCTLPTSSLAPLNLFSATWAPQRQFYLWGNPRSLRSFALGLALVASLDHTRSPLF